MTAQPTNFLGSGPVTNRETEVPGASFDNGANLPGSCAPGIGINITTPATPVNPNDFTLLDQDGDTREPQVSHTVRLPSNLADQASLSCSGMNIVYSKK